MLSTNLLKKGCLSSFVTLFFILVLVYFLVYKTLVYTEESFGADDDFNAFYKDKPTGADNGDYLALNFQHTLDDEKTGSGNPCQTLDGSGPNFKSTVENGVGQGGGCGGDVASECNKRLRIKKKFKIRTTPSNLPGVDGADAIRLSTRDSRGPDDQTEIDSKMGLPCIYSGKSQSDGVRVTAGGKVIKIDQDASLAGNVECYKDSDAIQLMEHAREIEGEGGSYRQYAYFYPCQWNDSKSKCENVYNRRCILKD